MERGAVVLLVPQGAKVNVVDPGFGQRFTQLAL
jgi:hypothetical protein